MTDADAWRARMAADEERAEAAVVAMNQRHAVIPVGSEARCRNCRGEGRYREGTIGGQTVGMEPGGRVHVCPDCQGTGHERVIPAGPLSFVSKATADSLAAENAALVAERDEAIAERDAAVAEREEALATARELLSPDLMRDLRRSLETAQALNDLRAERDHYRDALEVIEQRTRHISGNAGHLGQLARDALTEGQET